MIFRFTTNRKDVRTDETALGDRTLFMGVDGKDLVGATYTYDI